ncbi:MAG TPA: bifunctional 4-hydroxy-2-oxoglutarate aldolase/2-dehydro-3-deoxy-phosphogluconate aldolase [Solimonas sp.]|nr:bifunctional 4-hydroxy-2-oxoglutarate aldolase/2-dehydro-3-deoxy-phosphogluconate aldolase [Solimonas sp.]
MNIKDILRRGPVMPVVVIDDAGHALPLARALLAGGIRAMEITLRTPAALAAISAIAAAVPEMAVGAGTLLSAQDVHAARDAGACFGVSPGLRPAVLSAAGDWPYLPGVMTPSEVMLAIESGHDTLKFFPAGSAGGASMVRAFGGPFSSVLFCPTGGITPLSAQAYLSLPNVACVGGSWLTPREHLQSGNWTEITRLAQQAATLRPA